MLAASALVVAVGERKGKGFNVSTPPPASRGDILLIPRWVYLTARGGRVAAALKCTATRRARRGGYCLDLVVCLTFERIAKFTADRRQLINPALASEAGQVERHF